MQLIKAIKLKFHMIKEIFAQKRNPNLDYYKAIEAEIISLKEQLTTIESKYGKKYDLIHNELSSDPENQSSINDFHMQMPKSIESEREEILRKLDIYCRQVERESDLKTISRRMTFGFLWLWLID
ncbi:MAG: hypothetical protein JSR17_07000 [Proteobacteria bacterium]|nr:hypothetical protein [Pseudomonadota bacterium]